MSKFKKILICSLILALAGTAAFFLLRSDEESSDPNYKVVETKWKVGGFNNGVCQPFGGATSTQQITGAGSHQYIEENNAFFIGANSTSTFECDMGNADIAQVNLHFVGSTTGAIPLIELQTSSNRVLWSDVLTAGTRLSNNSQPYATTTHAPMPNGSEGTTTPSFSVTLPVANFIRVKIGAGAAAATVWPELILRNQAN